MVNFDKDWVSCFYARNEIRRVFLPLIANVLFVSIKFVAGKGFCQILRPLWIHRVV